MVSFDTSARLLRRVAAFTFDLLVLNILGRLFAFPGDHLFVRLGNFGSFLGATIFVLYFVCFESVLPTSGSPGKLAVGLRVIDPGARKLSSIKSFGRSVIVIALWTALTSASTWEGSLGFRPHLVAINLILGFLLAQLIFPIFNRGLTIQDVITRSIVTRRSFESPSLDRKLQLKDLAWPVLISVLLGVTEIWEQRAWISTDPCQGYSYFSGTPFRTETGTFTIRYSCYSLPLSKPRAAVLTLELDTVEPSALTEDTITEQAHSLYRLGFRLHGPDTLRIVASYGFDIGIYWSFSTVEKDFSAKVFNAL